MYTNRVTENIVESIQKDSRRKMFWRLYNLPWMLLTLVLIIVIIYLAFITYQPNVVRNDSPLERNYILQGYNEVPPNFPQPFIAVAQLPKPEPNKPFSITSPYIVYTNGIDLVGHEMVLVDKDELSDFYLHAFRFNDLARLYDDFQILYGNYLTNIVYTCNGNKIHSRNVGGGVFSDGGDRYIRFGLEESLFSDSIGYDVELEIINSIEVGIYMVLTDWDGDSRDVLQLLLKDELSKQVIKSFDGFETYNKIKGKRGMR